MKDFLKKHGIPLYIDKKGNPMGDGRNAEYKLHVLCDLDIDNINERFCSRYSPLNGSKSQLLGPDSFSINCEIIEGYGKDMETCLLNMTNHWDSKKISKDELIEQLTKDKEYLLKVLYSITEAESPGDMFDTAKDALKKFNMSEAPLNY